MSAASSYLIALAVGGGAAVLYGVIRRRPLFWMTGLVVLVVYGLCVGGAALLN